VIGSAVARSALAVIAVVVCTGCNRAPGRPATDSAVVRPDEIVDFSLLYSQNCAGCHGANGKGGAAIALADPVYLAIADDTAIRGAATNGVPVTAMPAFARSAGGMLTDKQVGALVSGIRSWAKSDVLNNVTPPPYSSRTPGDPKHGAAVYATYCSSCHGPAGQGGGKASSIVNGAYLALVSDQELRTIVIAGRPELGAPDWRSDVPGHPMSPQEVSDVVAWLSAHRPQFPGQPYPISSADREKERPR
jgi:cytochrome c oxidase cbb3-type subunit 3